VSQARSIGVHTYVDSLCGTDDDMETRAAPKGFEPWDEEIVLVSGDDCGAITGSASMGSTLAANRIFARGDIGYSHDELQSLVGVAAECANVFRYRFSVAQETAYTITGSLTGAGFVGDLNHYIWVGSDSETLFSTPGSAGFATSGVLAPGEYRVELDLWFDYENFTHRPYDGGSLSYRFEMTLGGPACPCDWNEDDTLNSQDFFEFLTSFFAGDGDFNGSGATDSQDFFDFLGCFFEAPAGCA
jgi:hypothetical protein